MGRWPKEMAVQLKSCQLDMMKTISITYRRPDLSQMKIRIQQYRTRNWSVAVTEESNPKYNMPHSLNRPLEHSYQPSP